MKISTNTLTFITEKYGSVKRLLPDSIDELSQKIGAQLGAIESIELYGKKYEGVVVARVVSCVQHPNADRLHVCMIDDGGAIADITRNEDGYVQVVCGAPNVREGLLVAWLPPGSTVPDSVASDPFVLGSRELRGVMSNGMLASPKELAISDAHEGILELDGDIAPGTSFAEAFDLADDTIIDIENKMFTHRPDCFGWLGVAREIAGIQGKSFRSPSWYTRGINEVYDVKSNKSLPLDVINEFPSLVPRFFAVTMSDIEIRPSPLWLQLRLARHGVRPINNVVDITNFLMLETGQPMHAYDYDKVRKLDAANTATIVVRPPKKDETLTLLSGKTITPHEGAIVIASAQKAIGLGGVMGGADTEVSNETTNIILECASFDMYSIRRTAMTHGIFTDAVTRFTKGQSPLQNKQIAEKAMEMLEKYAAARFSTMCDDDHTTAVRRSVVVSAAFINERLGLTLTTDEIATLLANVEFSITVEAEELTVGVPFWRTDIEIAEDIVEEVGRLYGFDTLPLELPARSIAPVQKDLLLTTKAAVREVLARAGANEVLSYSFVHGKLLTKVGQNPDLAYSLSNALSPDLQYYRLSLTPSLLEKIHPNIKAGHSEFALFEIGKGHAIDVLDEDNLPREWTNVALVYAANDKQAIRKQGAAFYEAKRFALNLLDNLGVSYRIEPVDSDALDPLQTMVVAPYDTARLAVVYVGDTRIGCIGEFSGATRKSMKLPAYSAGFELHLEEMIRGRSARTTYQPLSRFPKVDQDITLRVPASISCSAIESVVRTALDAHTPEHVRHTLGVKDIYRADGADNIHYTFAISVVSYEMTLTDKMVNGLLDGIASATNAQLGAERI